MCLYLVLCNMGLGTRGFKQSAQRLQAGHHMFNGLLGSGEAKKLYTDT